jgi:two-component system cell cycle response regulator
MNQALLEKVLRCPRLPSLPTIAIEVIELCRQSDINIRQIATTISNDPALTTKILRTVNSSYYGLSQSVSTISHALVILGLNSVKTLALGFSLVGGMKGSSDREELMGFWQRSLYSAVASRTIAKHIGLAQHEEAFLGGLLQDVGVMAMLETLGDEYQALVQEAAGDHARLRDLEQAQLETDHAEIGGALAEEWRLPPILLTPIRFHETPDQTRRRRCVRWCRRCTWAPWRRVCSWRRTPQRCSSFSADCAMSSTSTPPRPSNCSRPSATRRRR